MPNPGAERPLRKVTLNLFEEDCCEFERVHGQGWTTRIREVVHRAAHQTKQVRSRRTLSDLGHIGDYDE